MISQTGIITIITKVMEKWGVEQAAREETLAEIKIRRDIFQGNIIVIIICYCNDTTEWSVKKMQKKLQIYKAARKY